MPQKTNESGRIANLFSPSHSLRARLSLTYGSLTITLTTLLIATLEWIDRGNRIGLAKDPYLIIQQLQLQLLLFGIVFTLVFLIIGWIIAGRIARPLVVITNAAHHIRTDGREHVIPTFAGHDEIASLSRSLNYLVADLAAQKNALQTAKEELEVRVVERTRKLAMLYDVLETAVNQDDLSAIVGQPLHQLLSIVRGRAGMVHIREHDDNTLRLTAQMGLDETNLAPLRRLPSTNKVLQQVMTSAEPLLLVDRTPDFYIAGLMEKTDTYLGIPIQANNQCWGVFSLISTNLAQITTEERDLLQTVANQVAATVERFYLRQQAAQLAVVEERNRLARELHDSVTQAIYSTTLFAEAGQRMAQIGNTEKALSYLDEVLDTSRQALQEMRLLVYKLRPSTLEKEGLAAALSYRLKAVEGRAGIEQQLALHGPLSLSPELEDTLYHIAVEALNNSLKHARATAVSVQLAQENNDTVQLIVSDNGRGFEMETAVNAGGMGLTSMAERTAEQSGTFDIQTAPGKGTKITVCLPIKNNI